MDHTYLYGKGGRTMNNQNPNPAAVFSSQDHNYPTLCNSANNSISSFPHQTQYMTSGVMQQQHYQQQHQQQQSSIQSGNTQTISVTNNFKVANKTGPTTGAVPSIPSWYSSSLNHRDNMTHFQSQQQSSLNNVHSSVASPPLSNLNSLEPPPPYQAKADDDDYCSLFALPHQHITNHQSHVSLESSKFYAGGSYNYMQPSTTSFVNSASEAKKYAAPMQQRMPYNQTPNASFSTFSTQPFSTRGTSATSENVQNFFDVKSSQQSQQPMQQMQQSIQNQWPSNGANSSIVQPVYRGNSWKWENNQKSWDPQSNNSLLGTANNCRQIDDTTRGSFVRPGSSGPNVWRQPQPLKTDNWTVSHWAPQESDRNARSVNGIPHKNWRHARVDQSGANRLARFSPNQARKDTRGERSERELWDPNESKPRRSPVVSQSTTAAADVSSYIGNGNSSSNICNLSGGGDRTTLSASSNEVAAVAAADSTSKAGGEITKSFEVMKRADPPPVVEAAVDRPFLVKTGENTVKKIEQPANNKIVTPTAEAKKSLAASSSKNSNTSNVKSEPNKSIKTSAKTTNSNEHHRSSSLQQRKNYKPRLQQQQHHGRNGGNKIPSLLSIVLPPQQRNVPPIPPPYMYEGFHHPHDPYRPQPPFIPPPPNHNWPRMRGELYGGPLQFDHPQHHYFSGPRGRNGGNSGGGAHFVQPRHPFPPPPPPTPSSQQQQEMMMMNMMMREFEMENEMEMMDMMHPEDIFINRMIRNQQEAAYRASGLPPGTPMRMNMIPPDLNEWMHPAQNKVKPSLDDRHVDEKHSKIYSDEGELESVNEIVQLLEKVFKTLSDQFVNEDDPLPKREEDLNEEKDSSEQGDGDKLSSAAADKPSVVAKVEGGSGEGKPSSSSSAIQENKSDESAASKKPKVQILKRPKRSAKKVPDTRARVLHGCNRVGFLGKGLLMRGDHHVELVLLCTPIPTKTLLKRVLSQLPNKIKEERPDLSFSITKSKAGFVVAANLRVDVKVTVTLSSTLVKPNKSKEDKKQEDSVTTHNDEKESAADQDEVKEKTTEVSADAAGEEEKTVKNNAECCDGDEILDLKEQLMALSKVRRTKWFVDRAIKHESCVIIIRILREMQQRVPVWAPLSCWAIENLTYSALSSSNEHMSRGDAFRRLFEVIAGGILLPDGPGLLDPCEREPVDVLECCNEQQLEDITRYAQKALSLITFRGIHQVLGMQKISTHYHHHHSANNRYQPNSLVKSNAKQIKIAQPKEVIMRKATLDKKDKTDDAAVSTAKAANAVDDNKQEEKEEENIFCHSIESGKTTALSGEEGAAACRVINKGNDTSIIHTQVTAAVNKLNLTTNDHKDAGLLSPKAGHNAVTERKELDATSFEEPLLNGKK